MHSGLIGRGNEFSGNVIIRSKGPATKHLYKQMYSLPVGGRQLYAAELGGDRLGVDQSNTANRNIARDCVERFALGLVLFI